MQFLCRLAACLAAAVAPLAVPPAHAQIFRLEHGDTTHGNFFGAAVALEGRFALVGASADSSCGENAGAAYVYGRDPATGLWNAEGRLLPDDCRPGLFFGRAVALSGDRALIAASAPVFGEGDANAAYVFERDPLTGRWQQTARLTSPEEGREGAFATGVALQGDRAVVTTSGDPTGGQYDGAAYVFERIPHTGRWWVVARLVGMGGPPGSIFGGACALDGDRIAVAASTYFRYRPGSVYVFERDPRGLWGQAARLDGIDGFFIPLDLQGDRLLVGAPRAGPHRSGLALLYGRDAGGRWRLAAQLAPAVPYDDGAFGSEVSLDGDRALVAGYAEQLGLGYNADRVVYVFERNTTTGAWAQQRLYDVGDPAFGAAIDHQGGEALVGQAAEREPGAAYTIRLP